MTLDEFITLALAEDTGDGDHTSLACISPYETGKARLLIKDSGILAGIELAEEIFFHVDQGLKIDVMLPDASEVKPGDVAFIVEGKVRSILQAERVVLNCMQRMSGIATLTRKMVNQLEGLNTKVLDTRKTTPCFRIAEKWAVRIGGGENHRFGLFDMILIKDNHIDYAGGINPAILSVVRYQQGKATRLKVEIEARTLGEVNEIIKTGKVHRILLDNFSLDNLKAAVALIEGKYETEASGGITLDNIRQYAETGVDYISVGALTHSFKSLDMSLKAVK